MLAVMKLGAVIVPTATAAGPPTSPTGWRAAAPGPSSPPPTRRPSSTASPGDFVRICVGRGRRVGRPARGVCRSRRAASPTPRHRARRPAPALLHVRHDGPAQARRAHPGLLPRRAPVHGVLARPAARRRAPQPLQPGLGQARLVLLLRAVDRRGDDRRAQLRALRRRPAARRAARARGHQLLRAADGVADAHQRRPVRRPGTLREVVGAGEPLNPEVIEQVAPRVGPDLRDGYGQTEMTAAVGNTPGSPVKPGSMGRPLPGVPVVARRPASSGRRVDGAGRGRALPRPRRSTRCRS